MPKKSVKKQKQKSSSDPKTKAFRNISLIVIIALVLIAISLILNPSTPIDQDVLFSPSATPSPSSTSSPSPSSSPNPCPEMTDTTELLANIPDNEVDYWNSRDQFIESAEERCNFYGRFKSPTGEQIQSQRREADSNKALCNNYACLYSPLPQPPYQEGYVCHYIICNYAIRTIRTSVSQMKLNCKDQDNNVASHPSYSNNWQPYNPDIVEDHGGGKEFFGLASLHYDIGPYSCNPYS